MQAGKEKKKGELINCVWRALMKWSEGLPSWPSMSAVYSLRVVINY